MSKRDPLILLEAHTQIAWTQIAGLRNRIVHDYFGLDLEIIWEIIRHDLPELEKQVRALQNR